jgi:SAM-dependent methyltransferase
VAGFCSSAESRQRIHAHRTGHDETPTDGTTVVTAQARCQALTGCHSLECLGEHKQILLSDTPKSAWHLSSYQLWPHSGLRSKVPERTGYEKSAHLYDLFDRKENVEFFHHYAAKAGEILDIGAGTGRIAIPLARRGVSVCCVEPSPAMRREFEAKLREEPHLWERITLTEGEAISFDLGRTFPAAFLSGSFDHLLDDEERLSALRNIGRHLSDGGVLVFDVFLGLMKGTPLSPAGVVQAGGREIRRLVGGRMLSGQRKETTLVFEVYEKGELVERIEERSLVGITDRRALHRLLEMAGFEVQREWGDYDFRPFEEGDSLLIVEARDPKGFPKPLGSP